MRRTISHSQSFSIPLDLLERLSAVAGELRVSRSAFVVQAIRRELEHHEHKAKVAVGEVDGAKQPVATRS